MWAHVTVRHVPTGHHDYHLRDAPAVRERWVRAKDVDIRQRKNNVSGNLVTVRIRDEEGAVDFEHDPCSVVNFEVVCAVVDYDIYPSIFIYGHIAEMGWSDKSTADPDGEGGAPAYVPAKDPDWKPGLYQVSIWMLDSKPEV